MFLLRTTINLEREMRLRKNTPKSGNKYSIDRAVRVYVRRDRQGVEHHLFKDYSHGYFIYKADETGAITPIKPERALEIILTEEKRESVEIMKSLNPILRTGLCKTVDGVCCDTTADTILATFERNKERAVAVYRVSNDKCYLHFVESGNEDIMLFDEKDCPAMIGILDFWSYENEPVDRYVDFMLGSGGHFVT
jgi:hypothetical protein